MGARLVLWAEACQIVLRYLNLECGKANLKLENVGAPQTQDSTANEKDEWRYSSV